MTAALDQLIALFNQRSLDLPDGMFTRHTQFRLNGVAFENMLGRAPDDPLVLMLARGAAGYRFTAKAVQHAIPDATVQRGELRQNSVDGRAVVEGEAWISGHYRGTGEAAEVLLSFVVVARAGAVERIDVTLDEPALSKVSDARRRG
jgi:hypothetical protein